MELNFDLTETLEEYQTKISELKETLIKLEEQKEEFNKLFPNHILKIKYSWDEK